MMNMMVLLINYKQEINNEILLLIMMLIFLGNKAAASTMIFNVKEVINISNNDNILEIQSKNKNNEIIVTKLKYEKDYDINKSIVRNEKEKIIGRNMGELNQLEEMSLYELKQFEDLENILEDLDEEFLERERIKKAKKERIQISEIFSANNISSDGRKRL